MHAFIQHLLHDVLMKRTLDKVLRLLRKLHWEDAEVCPLFFLFPGRDSSPGSHTMVNPKMLT